MPFANNNILLQGLSGKLGNIVVRQLNGKTIVQAAPVRKAPFTSGELKNQERFKQAVAYAKHARQNAEMWEIYLAEAKRRGGTSNAFAVAVSDFRDGCRLVKALLVGRLKVRKRELKRKVRNYGVANYLSAFVTNPGIEADKLKPKVKELSSFKVSHLTWGISRSVLSPA